MLHEIQQILDMHDSEQNSDQVDRIDKQGYLKANLLICLGKPKVCWMSSESSVDNKVEAKPGE